MTILKLRSRPSLIISQFLLLALTACSDGMLLDAANSNSTSSSTTSSSSTSAKQAGNVVNSPSSTATTNTIAVPASKVAAATTITTTPSPTKTTSGTSSTNTAAPTSARAPAPASAPVAVATPNAGGATVNSLNAIVNDMALRNDFVLRGYEGNSVGWYVGPGYVVMGNNPNTNNTPSFFKAANPNLLGIELKAILPLVVIFDGTSNSATNTRVQMKNIKLIIKSKSTQQWRVIAVSAGLGGFNTPKSTLFGGSDPENKRIDADGSVEVKPPTNPGLAWHGWWNNGRMAIDPYDIDAVFITMQARLTVDDASLADDRDSSQFGIQIGADYYIDTNTAWQVINPSAMLSRTKRVTKDWQAFNAMTFSDVGIQEPGGGISEAAFRASPPPLE
jgi:hypothetical protein